MTIGDLINLAATLAALMGAVYAIWRGRKTTRAEVSNVDADTSTKFAQLARDAGERWAYVEGKYNALADRLEIIEANNDVLVDYVETLLKGLERLTHQLRAANMEPVWSPPAMPKLRDTGELRARKDA